MTVYHPASWALNWPKDARPYASKEIAVAHGHTPESIVESSFIGNPAFVVNEPPSPAPALSETEQAFIAENPNAVTNALVPTEASPETPEEPAIPASKTLKVAKTKKR